MEASGNTKNFPIKFALSSHPVNRQRIWTKFIRAATACALWVDLHRQTPHRLLAVIDCLGYKLDLPWRNKTKYGKEKRFTADHGYFMTVVALMNLVQIL